MTLTITKDVQFPKGLSPCSGTPFAAITASNREEVIILLKKCIELQRKGNLELYGFTISMPCGSEKRFLLPHDIPLGDLPCPCGSAGFYMIKYQKEREV